ncbi:MAG: TonB-dependent receptor [Flavobacteriaceae bacterium]
MKRNTLKLSVLTLLLSAQIAVAQEEQKEKVEQLDEVVLSDTKFELKKENSGKIIYKITKKQIEQSSGKTVADLLDQVAGVEVSGNNNAAGYPIGIYIRGGRNRQVAIAIDGVLVSDPTGIASTYNLNLLDLNEVESIEILKGSSSTLYGSGAAAGVINITLKKASKAPISFNYTASMGTNNTQRNRNSKLENLNQSVGLRGTLNTFNYIANYSISKSDGMSSANDKDAITLFTTDAYNSDAAMVKLGFEASEKLTFEVFGNYNQYKYDYDAGAYFDSEVNNGYEEQFQYGLKSGYKYEKGELLVTLSASDLERGFDSFNSWSNTLDSYLYKGTSFYAEAINKYNFLEKSHLILGINYQDFDNQTNTPFGDIDKDKANYNTIDPFASYIFTGDNGLNLNAGVRLNNHSEYGSHLVYHINPSYNIIQSDKWNLKALTSYSTAFIAPSTYQLFSQYGNLDLDPEENATFEFGFDSSYKKLLSLSSVFFYREEKSTIIFVSDPVTFVGGYENATDKQNVKGVETALSLKPLKNLQLNLSHTYTHKSYDLDYIPSHKIIASIDYQPIRRMNVSVVYKGVGERTYFDQWGSFGPASEDVILDAYNLVDFNINYGIENVIAFVNLSNIFNEDYEDVLGYSTRGRNFLVGLKFKF